MNSKQLRVVMRWLHIIGGAIIATYIYSPWTDDPVFSLVVQVVVIPALIISGIVMWQQGRIMKWLRNNRSERAI